MMIEIRRAEEHHIPQILDIEGESFGQPWLEGGFIRELDHEDTFFTVAFSGEAVLGYCILHQCGEEAELYKIAVDRRARRCGVADRLMASAVDYASIVGIKRIFLEVRESNAAAVALYEKHGFRCIGRRHGYYDRPREDAVIMEKPVQSIS